MRLQLVLREDRQGNTRCLVAQDLALLIKVRTLIHEEISLLTVLYFPFRARTLFSSATAGLKILVPTSIRPTYGRSACWVIKQTTCEAAAPNTLQLSSSWMISPCSRQRRPKKVKEEWGRSSGPRTARQPFTSDRSMRDTHSVLASLEVLE